MINFYSFIRSRESRINVDSHVPFNSGLAIAEKDQIIMELQETIQVSHYHYYYIIIIISFFLLVINYEGQQIRTLDKSEGHKNTRNGENNKKMITIITNDSFSMFFNTIIISSFIH